MALAVGMKLGPYEILALLGSGGMGEVWKARDTRLDRTVAVKVLSTRIDSPAARERFEREAKAVSGISHPHICTLYDVGNQDGLEYLVMEYLEGQSLADRLLSGPLPLSSVLEHAIQIVSALEAAHRKGVIHRDLKPGNIMVTKAGAKLLDFGLAKMGKTPAPAATVTLTRALTAEGSIVGTLQYVSPEQLEGQEADARSDLFAFGAVLYEMLTGRKAFEGRSQSNVIAAIMHVDPPDVSTLQPLTPPALERLVKSCLAKDPAERRQTAHDLVSEFRWILEGGAQASAVAKPSAARRTRERLAMGLAAVLMVAIAMVFYSRRPAPDAPAVRFLIFPPDKTSFDLSNLTGIPNYNAGSISPNGRKLAFVGRDQAANVVLWIRSLDNLTPQALTGTEGAAWPFWSPDSRSVAFFAQGKLKEIDIEGGPPRIICDAVNPRGGSWSRDGLILFGTAAGAPLFRVLAGGGEPSPVSKVQQQASHQYPAFLPDGRHFLSFTPATNEVWIGSLDSEEKRLLAADSPAFYAPPGYLLFVRQGTLLAQPFDGRGTQLQGAAIPITEQVAFAGGVPAFSVSDNGILTYRTGMGLANLQLLWVDKSGRVIGTLGTPGAFLGPDLSPDGKRLVIHRHDPSGGDVWVVEVSNGRTSRLTFDASQDNASPIWSPDGSRIAFGSRRNGKWGIYQKLSNGTGPEELIFESEVIKMPMSWSPDGKWILYMSVDPKSGQDMWAVPLTGDRKAVPVVQTAFNKGHGQFSPDGKWIAYESSETGRSEIYVLSFQPGAVKFPISSTGGQFPRWRKDGKQLYYLDALNLGKMMSVDITATGSALQSSEPVSLFESAYVNTPGGHSGNWNPFVVSADGERFLIPRLEANFAGALTNSPITVVENWPAGLKK